MRKRNLGALLIAGVMMVSNALPVMAADNETIVGFTKGATNTAYTMTIPAGNTAIAKDGSLSSIGELKITSEGSFDEACEVVVEVSYSGYLTNTNSSYVNNNKIEYSLYTGGEKTNDNIVTVNRSKDYLQWNNTNMIEFTAANIDAQTPVEMGAAISGTNYASLEAGDYRDTVTFDASLWKPLTNSGVTILVSEGKTWYEIRQINNGVTDFNGDIRVEGKYIKLNGNFLRGYSYVYTSSDTYTW